VSRIWAAISRLDKAAAPKPEPAAEARKSEAKARSIKKASAKPSTSAAKKRVSAARPKAGLIYERAYKGKSYRLTSAADKDGKVSYKLRGGETYDSLTAAAKAVTQYPSISGPAFWGPSAKDSGASE